MKRGAILIEMMIYIALLLFGFMITLDLLTQSTEVSLRSGGKAAISGEGRFILERLSQDIRDSNSVVDPTAAIDVRGTGSVDSGNNSGWLFVNPGE